jgi:hypothetical protein
MKRATLEIGTSGSIEKKDVFPARVLEEEPQMQKRLELWTFVAVLVLPPAFADQAPAPAPGTYPYANPFDPNWWLAGMSPLLKAPGVTPQPGAAAAFPVAPVPFLPQAATPAPGLPTYPTGDVNYRGYIPVKTPYGTVHMFDAADPGAWNYLLSPYAIPVAPSAATAK